MDYMASKTLSGVDIDTLVELYLHVYPLPQFHHSFFVSKPAIITWEKTKDGRKVADYIKWGLLNQDTFKSKGVNLTETQLVSKICNLAANKFGWTEAECLTNFNKYNIEMGM